MSATLDFNPCQGKSWSKYDLKVGNFNQRNVKREKWRILSGKSSNHLSRRIENTSLEKKGDNTVSLT